MLECEIAETCLQPVALPKAHQPNSNLERHFIKEFVKGLIKELIKELWRAQRAEMFGAYVDFFMDFLMKIRVTPASDLEFLKTVVY